MTRQEVNVLFTSAGRRVELLRAFRKAYEDLGLEGNIVALDIDPLAPALQVADCAYIVPRSSDPDYVPTLLGICRRERVHLLFPLIDPDIIVLATHHEAILAIGSRPAVVSRAVAEMTADKWQTAQFFRGLKLPTAQSWLPGQIDTEHVDYPLFIKPRRGSAAKNTFKVHNAREAEFFIGYVSDPIIESFLPGPEITTDVICSLDGDLLATVSRKRIEVRWGEVAKGVTLFDPEISDACAKIAKALPAVGPITVQCMMKDGVACFTEINARFGGGVPLAISAGAHFAHWLLSRAAGLGLEVPPIGSYVTGLYITRFDDSFFISEVKREQLASHRVRP